jgi:hypothetical protein
LASDSFSLLFGLSSLFAIKIFFVVAAATAVSLILGYRTRLCTFLLWLFMMSIQARNPLILYGVDDLFRLFLFWSIFLPLGGLWSVDSFRKPKFLKKSYVSNIASFAFIFQLISIYWVSVFLKSSPEWWPDLTAVFYSLNLDMYSSSIGRKLLAFPDLLQVLTAFVLGLELVVPALLLLPFRQNLFRALSAALFIGFHLGLAVLMNIHLFPYVCVAIWLAIIPSNVWETISVKVSQMRDGVPEKESRVQSFVIIIALLLSFFWNLESLGVQRQPSQALRSMTSYLGLQQYWGMFAPAPRAADGWLVVEATQVNGKKFDWITGPGKDLSFDRPKDFQTRLKNARWKKFYEKLILKEMGPYRESFARFVCKDWNAKRLNDHRTQIGVLKVYYMLEWVSRTEGSAPIQRVSLIEFDCIDDKVKI